MDGDQDLIAKVRMLRRIVPDATSPLLERYARIMQSALEAEHRHEPHGPRTGNLSRGYRTFRYRGGWAIQNDASDSYGRHYSGFVLGVGTGPGSSRVRNGQARNAEAAGWFLGMDVVEPFLDEAADELGDMVEALWVSKKIFSYRSKR